MKSTPKTFQRKLILYNLLIVICIASAVSFFNYNSYRKDVIVAETKSSQNRINGLSARMGVAYDEMVSTAPSGNLCFSPPPFPNTGRGTAIPRRLSMRLTC